MKAVLCKQFGLPESLVVEDIPSPKAGKKQVVISIKACGVNFPDTLIIQGLYQFKPSFPFIPGSDVAGVVKEAGEGVSQYKPGDKVFALISHGGFAEEVMVASNQVFPIPSGMNFQQAAAFTMVYGTSYHGLKDRANLQPGETLLVLGAAGGVGLAAVELGKAMGAKVIAAASTDDKLAICKEHGADEGINYSEEDLKTKVKELTGGKGADVIYDPVGGHYSETAFRAIAWKGRFLVVGFAVGEIPKIPLNLPLLKGADIQGVFWGAFTQKEPDKNMANTMKLIQWFGAGKLKPHIHGTYSLAEVPKALNALMNREVKGKVLIMP